MAATKYQLLYRYINEATNIAITNESTEEYVPVREFYTMDHAIFSSDAQTKATAEDEQQEMIANANDPSNIKTNMLFAFEGTKKVRHQKWTPDETGYVVRDWSQIPRSRIGNRGDFTKEFTTLNVATPEDGGMVVCKKTIFNKYFPSTITVASDNSLADAGSGDNKYYTEAKINQLITESTMFQLNTAGYADHTSPSRSATHRKNYYDYVTYYTGPVAIGGNNMSTHTYPSYNSSSITVFCQENDKNLYSQVTITQSQVETVQIPGHYEDTTEYPYLVIDTYKAIPMSPWFVHATYGSLEAALTKAKTLVDMLGIENIKLIKVVPFDQFIKIS